MKQQSPNNLTYILGGAIFWFLAAMFIRFAEPIFGGGSLSISLLYLLTIPAAYLSVVIIARLVRVPRPELLVPITVMTITAVLLDGLFLAFYPQLYFADGPQQVAGPAWLLWGLAFILYFALPRKG